LLPGKEYVDLLKFNVPALTAKTRVEQSNAASAEGAGGRAGAAAEAKKAAASAAPGSSGAGAGEEMSGIEGADGVGRGVVCSRGMPQQGDAEMS
jgi:hypothetical protein